jgi:hypothetical protein
LNNNRLHLNRFLATGVGSLPFTDPRQACDLVFGHFKDDIPFWPQLPKRNFKENMYAQFSERIPGVTIDEAAKEIFINSAKDTYTQELEAVYERYLADDVEYFSVGEDYAGGLYEFIQHPQPRIKYPFVKGQIIGPISFGLTVTDQNKKASIYNQEFCDCLMKSLAMRARWQVHKLQIANRQSQIIIFIDEPYLVSVGSTFFNISAQSVVNMLNEMVEAIHKEKAFAGIHCCGNTDWGMVLRSKIDILNFDAYNYLETIFLYRKELNDFLKRGGILAWGIVPTAAADTLPGIQVLLEKIGGSPDGYGLITPSCGLSGVPAKRAEEILVLSAQLSKRLSA